MASQVSTFRKELSDKVSYRLRTFAGGRFASLCRPVWISFLLTELCNARCVHCDIWKNRGKEESPTVEQWKAAMLDLRQWLGAAHICLTGGEALLRPFTVDLLRYGSEIGLRIELLSHGYWSDQSKIEQVAMAKPWRVTVSHDGLGETHSRVRGRDDFFEKTHTTLQTLKRIRAERNLGYTVLLKNVLMSHNLHDAERLARFAQENGFNILYQPIEQNYNTVEDPEWYLRTDNWPTDVAAMEKTIQKLIELKRQGLPIVNNERQLEVMIPYFRDPAAYRVRVQAHTAHERRASCAALELIQVHANGDVRVCSTSPPVGNIKNASLRNIWNARPRWWEGGCCMERRLSPAERELVNISKG